ncbi:MAG: class I SAM-dependent DNA methyltransferase [Ignavibacteria bacterium]|nr:class I SAM-dependent DNA methyltransferase [Ignavibacteria bacterium]
MRYLIIQFSKAIRKQTKSLPTLEYILKFLDAYDFSSEGTEDIQESNRTLINASVLGKVFEKINGYKDGSIFTPGFITMYMCREAIRPAVAQKFKDKYNWKADSFDDLRNFMMDKKSAEDVRGIQRDDQPLKICDPAVGSGHFLVSSLNEIIAIKSELGIFADEYGNADPGLPIFQSSRMNLSQPTGREIF